MISGHIVGAAHSTTIPSIPTLSPPKFFALHSLLVYSASVTTSVPVPETATLGLFELTRTPVDEYVSQDNRYTTWHSGRETSRLLVDIETSR